jgi:uncharacterized membrane protein YvbJ
MLESVHENMSLTQCPNCHRQCFTDALFCPSCGQTFKPGKLEAQAFANERRFTTKVNALFLSLFLASLAVLVFVEVQAYLNGVGFFRP